VVPGAGTLVVGIECCCRLPTHYTRQHLKVSYFTNEAKCAVVSFSYVHNVVVECCHCHSVIVSWDQNITPE